MIKRTIEVSRDPAHLAVRYDQLLLSRGSQTVGQIPCEDIGVIVVDHPQATYTHAALATLAEHDAALVVCGRNHLPVAMMLPLADHTQVVSRIRQQITAGKPLRKRLWQQLIRAKIRAQAENLAANSPPQRRLLEFARQVRSGDPSNLEAQAAKTYWAAWLVNAPEDVAGRLESFRRDPDQPGLNALLNYGYSVLRAAVARAIVSAGLVPAVGLHHSHRANAFCLADDLLEPLRPFVDERVRELTFAGQDALDQPTKAALLELLVMEVQCGPETGPLMVALHDYAASLAHCFEGPKGRLRIPHRCICPATDPCGS